MPELLRVENLTVKYGRAVTAVRGVSLEVGAGETVGILGSNGAGKTSLIRGIGGLLSLEPAKVSSGTMVLDGQSVKPGISPSRMSKLGVTLVPERLKVFSSLTVTEHFHLLKASRAEVDDFCDRFPWLKPLLAHGAGDLSGGQRQLLGLLCALVRKPKLLLIDEFSLGLAPAAIAEVSSAIAWAQSEIGVSVLLVEQNVDVASTLCDRVYLMTSGELLWSGTPADARERVLAGAYFA